MTLSPIAGPLLSEQFELIREIARNLVGDAEAPGARLPMHAAQPLPDGAQPGGDRSGDEGVSYRTAADRQTNAAPALSLFGLRPAFARQTGSASSQGAEIQRLIEIFARGPAPTSVVETIAAREGTTPAGERGRPDTGETDKSPVPANPRNDVVGTLPRVGLVIAPEGGDTGTPSQSEVGQTSGDDGVATPARTAVGPGATMNLAGLWSTSAPLAEAAMPGSAGAAAETGDALSGEQRAALAVESADRQARREAALATTRAAHGPSSHQAAVLADRADAPARAPVELASVANAVATMRADLEAAVRSAIADRNLAALGPGDMAAQMAAQAAGAAPERAGVIASFILNAHFQPGWPPLRPIQSAQAVDLAGQLAQAEKLIASDREMLIYLANFGVNIEQIARILKLAPRARHRSKLLAAILGFLVNFSTVVRLLQEELSALLEELGAETQMLPRTASGKRLRTDLR